MRAARGYESLIAILNPGQLSHSGTTAVCAPEPYRNRGDRKTFACNPYWMQHLVRPQVSGQLRNGNKVGSPVSTLAGLPTTGMEDCPKGRITPW
jgi:hypothetical protein